MGVPWDHAEVEARWQARWTGARRHEVDRAGTDAAVATYNLVEFPYPSAEGLHIGHAMTYAGADTWGRLQRRYGRVVFQPMGFDSFGINAENYALRAGEHPASLMERTTANYRRQLEELGAAWSWDAVVSTSDPSYYRWTQWVFLRLLAAGLAYQAEAPVLWCPDCMTVLAREQVEDDVCERCGAVVVERVMRQWFLRITAYADRLRAGLDALDWPDPAKNRQRRWIDGMHDWLISRQRFWGPPIPVVHCPGCGVVPVPDDELPVVLPDVCDVSALRPLGDGRSPLARIESWVHVPCPECGAAARRETDVSDTFFDSSWYFLRYPSTDFDDRPWDAARTERWLPVDQYAGGPEHVARHHLYARFVTMALSDLGLVPFAEPFPRIRLHGFLTMGGAKMSKSRGNVVNPDDLVRGHGADVTRLALLFGRPWDADGDFDAAVVNGVERFLGRVWRVATAAAADDDHGDAVASAAARVASSIEATTFNKAISALMELTNAMQRSAPSAGAQRALVSLLAPLAPHVTEELWGRLGGGLSVHDQAWPE
jgi:leucyl-tRNA synthetase